MSDRTDELGSQPSLTGIKTDLLQVQQGERTPAQLQTSVKSVNRLEEIISEETTETDQLLPVVIETFDTEIHHDYTSPAFEKSRYGSELITGLTRCLHTYAVASPDEFDGQIRPLVDALEPADEDVSELLLKTLVELVPVAGEEIATETEPFLKAIEYNRGPVRREGVKLLALLAATTSAVNTTVLDRIEIYDPLTNGWAAILESVGTEERIPATTIDKLVDGLYADSDATRIQAAKGLGDICTVASTQVPTSVVLDALENGLYDPQAEVRSAIIEAHRTLVTQYPSEEDHSRVVDLLVHGLNDESEEVRRATAAVLRDLTTTGSPQNDVLLEDVLRRIENPSLEQDSIREALGEIARTTSTNSLGYQIIAQFTEKAQETNDRFREEDDIVTELGEIANNAQNKEIAVTAVWALITLLRRESRTGREFAAEQLGSIGTFPTTYATRTVIDTLDEQLRSDSIFDQEPLAEALAQIIISREGGQSPIAKRVLSKLKTAFKSTNRSVASAAAVGLATVARKTGADGAALDILTTAIQSEEKSHQLVSIEALGMVAATGNPQPRETACDVLFKPLDDPEIRAEAAAALLGEHTTDRPDLSHEEFRRVLTALEPAKAPPTVCKSIGEFAATATSHMIADEAFDFLVQAVEQNHEIGQSRIIEALSHVCIESPVLDTSRGVTALESMLERYDEPEMMTTIVSELETFALETDTSAPRILQEYITQMDNVDEEIQRSLANSICRVTAEMGAVELSPKEFELVVESVDLSVWDSEAVATGLATVAIARSDPEWETQVAERLWKQYESGDELDRKEVMTGAGKLAIDGQTVGRRGISLLLEGADDGLLVRSAATEQLSEFAEQHADTVNETTLCQLFRGLKTAHNAGSVGPVFCQGLSAIASETQTKDVGTAVVDLLSQTLAARGEAGAQAGRELATISEQATITEVGELAFERLAIATRFRSPSPDSEESKSKTVEFADDSMEIHGFGFDEELEYLHDPFAYLNGLKGFARLAALNPDRCTPFVSDIREILSSMPYQAPEDHPMVQMIDAYVIEILHQLPSTTTISATMTQQPGGRRPFRWNFV